MAHVLAHCDRPWWMRPPVWLITIAAVVLLTFAIVGIAERPAATPYSVFLDQLEAGNVASVIFRGMEIEGRFRRPLGSVPSVSAAQRDTFSTWVPDVGDPTLVSELRRQRVVIEVRTPSLWTWLLERVPWPMLFLVGAVAIAAVVRLLRGGKARSGLAMAAPAHGMVGLLSGLFAKPQQSADPPPDSDGRKDC